MDANTIEQTRLRAEQTRLRADLNPNAEYYRYFYAYYRQTPEVRDVIDRFIVNDSQKKGEQLMQTSLNFPPFNGKQQPTNYTPEQQQEAGSCQVLQFPRPQEAAVQRPLPAGDRTARKHCADEESPPGHRAYQDHPGPARPGRFVRI